MFKNLNRREWIIVTILFTFIPTICGLVLFHTTTMSMIVPCTPETAWNFLVTCIAGTNVLMSLSCGGIMWAIAAYIYLIGKIKNTPW